MPTYGMGDAIHEMRMRAGCTQEELAYGICTPGTLSRIENGKEVASKQVFEALCQRLCGMCHMGISFDTKIEMQRSKFRRQALLYLEQRELEKAKLALEGYHALKETDNPFCLQFALYTQAVYQAIQREREEEILPKLEQALEITMPNYKERMQAAKRKILLTYDEVYIMSNIGIAYAKNAQLEKAFHIFYYLKGYLESQRLELSESLKVYAMILGNFAWILEQQGRFEEAVKHCDTGIRICHLTGKYTVLPHLFCIKAWCLTASGNAMMAKKSRRQAKALFDITEHYRGYGSFAEFYKAREPIFVIF